MRTIIDSTEDLINYEGQIIGVSEWVPVTQEMLDRFSDVTKDYQWIHTDVERCRKESPSHSTIMHGYFQVALLPFMLNQIIHVNNLDRLINYSIDRLVFKSSVPVNSKLRLKAQIKSVKDIGNACVATIGCQLEMDNESTVVMEGSIKYIYYFKTNN